MQFEKTGGVEYCYVVCWEENHMKKICVDLQSADQRAPDSELLPIARVVHSLELFRFPVAFRGGSALLLRTLE